MNIDITIKEEKKIQKQIELPYYSHDVCYFLMITKNETIVCAKPDSGNELGCELEIYSPGDILYKNHLIQATVTGKQINESDFLEQYYRVRDKMNKTILNRDLSEYKYSIPTIL